MSEPKHPMQPLKRCSDGVIRFKRNKIVEFLLTAGPFDLNMLSRMPWDNEDYTQLMQLIGYSASGYAGLSTTPSELAKEADRRAEVLLGKEGQS